MAGHERQHYLPCAYLTHFAAVRIGRRRRWKVWRTDGAVHELKTAESQCCGSFFYSRTSAEKIEREFGEGEKLYGEIAARLSKHQNPNSERQYFGLLVMMLDLHIRGVAYAMGPEENFDDYLVRTAGVRNQVLFGARRTQSTDSEIIELFRQSWAVRIIEAPVGNTFITSDNPSVWFESPKEVSRLGVVLLPVTPTAYAVAFDQREFELAAQVATERDAAGLNRLQVQHSVACIYTNEELTPEQIAGVRAQFTGRFVQLGGMNTEKTWMASFVEWPEQFRFLRWVL